jgi:hypothetical protein
VIAARSLAHRFSCSAAILAAVRQKLHLSRCPNFPSRLSLPTWALSVSPLDLI